VNGISQLVTRSTRHNTNTMVTQLSTSSICVMVTVWSGLLDTAYITSFFHFHSSKVYQ